MEVSSTISGKIYVKFVRMNDELVLSDGTRLWLDVDFEHVQHTPVVGEVLADSDCGEYLKGDLVIMDRTMCEVAVHKDIFPKYRHGSLFGVFVDSSGVIARRRDGEDEPMNGFVVLVPVEEKVETSLIMLPKNSAVKGEVLLAPVDSGLVRGDLVYFRKWADVYLEHELHREFFKFPTVRMPKERILAKEKIG